MPRVFLVTLTSMLMVSAAAKADPDPPPAAAEDTDPHPVQAEPPERSAEPEHAEHVHGGHGGMPGDPLRLPMGREGSGTAWQPDQTPMHSHRFMAGDWMLMLHYNLLAGYDVQGSPRGDRQLM